MIDYNNFTISIWLPSTVMSSLVVCTYSIEFKVCPLIYFLFFPCFYMKLKFNKYLLILRLHFFVFFASLRGITRTFSFSLVKYIYFSFNLKLISTSKMDYRLTVLKPMACVGQYSSVVEIPCQAIATSIIEKE